MKKRDKKIKEIAIALCKDDGCDPNAIATTIQLEQYGNIKIIPHKLYCVPAWKWYLRKATIAYDLIILTTPN